MSPNSRLLYRLLVVASAINVLGLPFAVLRSEPLHATVHAGLALICGFLALRLRHRRPDRPDTLERLEGTPSDPTELGAGDQGQLNDEWLRRQQEYDRQSRREE